MQEQEKARSRPPASLSRPRTKSTRLVAGRAANRPGFQSAAPPPTVQPPRRPTPPPDLPETTAPARIHPTPPAAFLPLDLLFPTTSTALTPLRVADCSEAQTWNPPDEWTWAALLPQHSTHIQGGLRSRWSWKIVPQNDFIDVLGDFNHIPYQEAEN